MSKVVSISTGNPVSREIAKLAYGYWLARCFRNGSPQEDFLRAYRQITSRQKDCRATNLAPVRIATPECLPDDGFSAEWESYEHSRNRPAAPVGACIARSGHLGPGRAGIEEPQEVPAAEASR